MNPMNHKTIQAFPAETEDKTCVIDYLFTNDKNTGFDYEKVRHYGEDNFNLKIGGTTYEVSTHFNPKGRQCVMEQFKALILSEKLF